MRNKFNARKVTYNGIRFDSMFECAVYKSLEAQQRAGEIRDLKVQQKVYFTEAKILIKADFSFIRRHTAVLSVDHAGRTINTSTPKEAFTYAEAKGYETDTWKLKKRLYKVYGPAPLEIWKGTHLRPFLEETIVPKRNIST